MSDPINIIPRAVLGAPTQKPALGPFAQFIQTSFTGNMHFLTPSPTLVILAAAIALFAAAQQAVATRAAGTVTARNDAWLALLRILRQLRDYVQVTVEASPINAISMIESAGMKVAKITPRNKAELAAKQGTLSGVVVLVAKALAARGVYFWDFSVDQKNWTSVPQTLKATTQIGGLTPGQTYYFRFHGLTRKGLSDYSQVVSLIVK